MTERKPGAIDARAIMSRRTSLEAVDVEQVQPEIRSGINFLFRDALKRGVPAEVQAEISANLEKGTLIDRFITEWGFDVPFEKAKEFHAWLVPNEKLLDFYCPANVRYRGTYAVASGDRRLTGRYRTVWSFASFDGMQNLAEQLANEQSALRRLMDEFNSFRDHSSGAPEVEWIMLPAAGALRF